MSVNHSVANNGGYVEHGKLALEDYDKEEDHGSEEQPTSEWYENHR